MSIETVEVSDRPVVRTDPTGHAQAPTGQTPSSGPQRRKTAASIRWDYLVFFVSLHLLSLLVFVPYFFSWAGVAALVVGVLVFGQLAIPIAYHRLLAHRSFRSPKWFERTLVTLAMCTAQETPAQWVAWHRRHHSHADEAEDPHSPRVNWFWAHVQWLIHERRGTLQTFSTFEKYARDILADPYYKWIEKLPSPSGVFYFTHLILLTSLAAATTTWWYGWGAEAVRMTASLIVWGVFARTVWVWHITWSVNSVAHLFGYRNFDLQDDSRNNWFVALLTGGEGWHNNHHADPASATVQHRWWEFDPNYYVIRLLAMLGLVTDVVPPREQRRAASKATAKPR
ncbi:MAG: acyl-CoA desaturase [Planctomycetaceae bacterium]|nr:MAG: acyl-CoA desaturase [Planctomycetaceae bacterium]